jgi:hypothetical protein
MRRVLRSLFALALVAGLMTVSFSSGASGSTRQTPRWVKHVRNYPGGFSGTVRMSIRKSVIQAISRDHKIVRGGVRAAAGVNVQINDDTDPKLPQNETQVAYSEDDPLTAVAMSNDYVDGGLYIGTTHDGGNTWKSQRLVPRVAQTGDFCSGGDPAVVYSARDHTFYASQLCFMRAHAESAIQLIESRDGGDTWTGARYGSTVITNVASDGSADDSVFYDKEQLAVDNHPTSPNYGRLYMTYVKFVLDSTGFSTTCPVQLSYTDDVDPDDNGDLRDTAWSNTAIMPDRDGDDPDGVNTSSNQGAQPAVDDQGGLGISFFQEDCNTSYDRKILFKHVDAAGTVGPLVKINRKGDWKDNPNKSDILAPKNARLPASTSAPLVWNDTTGTFEFITQNNINRNGNKTGTPTGADISYTESHDYGNTWEHMKFVAVDGLGNPAPKDQFFPWMDVDELGDTHAIWFDNRNDPGNLLIETFHQTTSDTAVWGPNDNISTAAWDPNQAFFASGSFIGDYNGLAAGVSAAVLEYPVWTDGRNSPGAPYGDADIYTVPNNVP